MPRSKKISISKLRDSAWVWFSRYIRLRDCKGRTYLNCKTCSISTMFADAHAGHFQHGKNTLTYFMEDNVYGQCKKCNLYLSGNLDIYTLVLVDTLGRERVDELIEQNKIKHIWKREELEEIRDKYKNLCKELGYEK